MDHGIPDPVVPEAQVFTKDNKKKLEIDRNNQRNRDLVESRRQELLREKLLEEEAKKEADEKFRQERIDLEAKKIEIEKQLDIIHITCSA